ncbi:MAG: ABC transporter ATP-binding protein [Candidatus Kerfeldbacteria bacterium]
MPEKKKKKELLIEVKNLKKTYWNGDVPIPAVRGVDLKVKEGEFISLMGPSGSGKSTLMNLLAFLDEPSSGSYLFSGEDIESFTEDYRAQLRNFFIGFVFQQFHLLPRTTALDNVRLPLLYAGVNTAEQKQRAYDALVRVGLESRIYHRPNELSGGQQQRVSIARALVNNPKMIFCDEPTGNLDTVTAKEVMEIFEDLNGEGKTIIMVTHEANIAAYARRNLRMRDGMLV